MVNWMMRAAEVHLNILYEELHRLLTDSNLIHADETPFEVIRPLSHIIGINIPAITDITA